MSGDDSLVSVQFKAQRLSLPLGTALAHRRFWGTGVDFLFVMESERSNHGVGEPARALLAEVNTAIALVGLVRITSAHDTIVRLHESARECYERALSLMPEGLPLLTQEEEEIIRARLDPVREWLESTAVDSTSKH